MGGNESQPSQAAHFGPRGLSQKTCDKNAIPLCVNCHLEGKDAHHRDAKHFEQKHYLDVPALIARLNRVWELICCAKGKEPW